MWKHTQSGSLNFQLAQVDSLKLVVKVKPLTMYLSDSGAHKVGLDTFGPSPDSEAHPDDQVFLSFTLAQLGRGNLSLSTQVMAPMKNNGPW